MSRNPRWFALILAFAFALPQMAFAGDGVPLFLPFQGRATDSAGQPVDTAATFKFRIYPAAGICYIYEDTQVITPNGYGFFSVILGGLANRTGPANNFADVFNNDVIVTDSCAAPFDGAANEWRRLEVVVDGVPLPTMQTIAASAFSINSNMLDGKTSAGYLQVAGAATQAALATLTGGGDASALHHHDGRYVTLSGNNAIAGNITSSGSFYGVGAGSTIGIGTDSPVADFEIRRTSPSILLGATSGGGGTPTITFTSGATQRARIQASETTNELRFYTGVTEAMRLDAAQNLILTGSLQVGGTVGLGKYNNAQEATLITTLTGMGAAGVGTMWVNPDTNTFKFWNGTYAISLGSSTYTTSVTAGTGLTNSGTATAPILDVDYGTTAGTAIQGNAVHAGDVTGAYTNLVVTRMQGRDIASTAPAAGQLLTWNTTLSAWAPQTLTDGQLSSNVALKNAANIFTNTNAIQIPTATNVGLIVQTTDNNTTNSLLSLRNMAGTPIATVRADAVPTATTDLTTKTYVDTQDANKLNLSGGTMSGAINMGGTQITNMAAPTADAHAATKLYVDTNLGTRTLSTVAPTPNQILKWNGGQWEPSTDVDTGITALTGDVSASGNGSVAATIAVGAVDSAKILDSTIATADIGNLQVTDGKIAGVSVGKIASGAGQYLTYAPNNVACSPSETLKWNGTVWLCAADNNAGGTVTLVSGGAGLLGGNITGTGTLSVNTGVGANQILQLNGSSQIPAVDGSLLTFINAATLRGINLSTVAPTPGQVLKYNGSAWEASADTDTGITALSGDVTASGSGSVAATIRNDRIVTAMIKSTGGGLNRLLMTDAATGNNIDFADDCAPGDVLKWTGAVSGWACDQDVGAAGVVTSVSGGVGTTGGTITATGTIHVDVGVGANQILQLNGSSRIPAVDGSLLTFVNAVSIRGNNIATTAPTPGQVLAWNGSAWAPATDAGGDVTEVQTTSPLLGGGSVGGLTLSIDTGVTTGQIVQVAAANRLPVIDGSNLTFVNAATLRGVNLSTTAPTPGQVLKYNGSGWEAAADNNAGGTVTLVSGGAGLLGGNISGTGTLAVDVGVGANQIVQLDGSSALPAVNGAALTQINAARIRGVNLSTTAPTPGQVLKYNGSAWEAAADSNDGGDITSINNGTGILGGALFGDVTISVDVGVGANQILQLNGSSRIPAVDGSLLTFVNAASIRGNNVSTTAPAPGQVLAWNGSAWEAATDGGGDMTAVQTTSPLLGGGIVGGLTLSIDVGTGNNQVLQLNGSAQIPAVDGSLLTFVNAARIRGVNLSTTAPTPGQVLKFNGSAWEAAADTDSGITALSGDVTASGSGSVAATIRNDRITTAMIKSTGGGVNRLLMTDAATGNNIDFADDCSPGEVLKWSGAVGGWACGSDVGAAGVVTLVAGGVGTTGGSITATGTINVDVGTGNNQILQLNGSAQIPAVDGSLLTFVNAAAIRGVNLSTTAPTPGQVLKYNGSAWEASSDNNAGGTVTLVSGSTGLLGGNITGTGTLAVDVGTGNNQILQLNGSAQIPAVDGSLLTFINAATIRGVNLSTTAPTPGQVLKYNGSAWEASADNNAGGTLTLVAGGTGTTGGTITGTGTINVDVGTGNNQVLQLNGSAQIPAVDGSLLTFVNAAAIRGVNLSTTAPTPGQVLKYNGSAWEASADNNAGGDITEVATTSPLLGGGSAGGMTLSIDVGTGNNQVLQLNGSAQIPAVDGSLLTFVNAAAIRGVNLSTTAPTPGQVLKYNGSAWEAAADTDSGITALSGDVTASGSGSVAATIRNDRITTAMIKSTGGGVNRLLMTDAATGNNIDFADDCSPGEVLKWSGAVGGWACGTDVGAAGVVTLVAGGVGTTGGTITATGTIDIDVGTGNNQILQLNGSSQIPAVDGSLLTFVNAASIRGVNLSTTAPTPGQVLKYNGSAWEAAADTSSGGTVTLVSGGAGLLGGNISGTGTLAVDVGTGNNQILQLNGSSQIPAVDGSLLTFINAATIRGVNVSTTAPTPGQILTYNGSAWEAAAAPISGVTLVAGGVGTTGGSITATGTIDIDVGTGNNQILQLNGSSQIPAVDGSLLTFVNAASIRGVNLSTTAPTPGQVLKYNGSAWEAAADTSSGGTVTLVSGGAGLLGGNISGTGTLAVDVGTGNNQILQLNGSSQIPAVDGSLLTFINAATIRGVNVSTTAPTPGQILTYNGSAWEAAAAPISGVTLVAGGVGTTGGSITATGTIDIDVGTGNNQILQLNGSSQIPAVDGSLLTFVNAASIRGVNLSTTAPTPGQILTYNGSAWEAAAAPTSGINALSGDVTASGTGSVTATIRNDRITTAMIQSAGGGVNRLLITDSTTGANVTFADGCAQDEILKWNTTLGWDCSTDGNGGAVTLVVAGSGLVSGSISGTGTLAVDVGTGSNQIVQLNGSGQLPAVDGSLLTDLNLAAVTAGTLDVDSGGTGATSLTDNRLLLGNGTAAIGVLAAGTAGQLLQSGGASDPAWSTATFPTGAATQYDFLYASAANTWSSFATANTGAMVTSSAGVPSWASGAVANRLLRTDGTTISFAQVNPTTDIAQGTGAVTIESVNAGTSTFGNATGAATTVVRSGTGGVDITSTGTNINAVDITATGAGGGVTIASNASGAFAMNGGTGANSIITSTRVAAGGLTLRTTGGGAATTLLTSNGTSAAAVNITATGAGGGITLTPNATGHTIISAGRLSVGAGNTPAYTLDVAGSGQFTGNVHALAFFYTSDGRLKENFTPSPGLEAINQLNGYRFNWKKDQSPEIGLIAQEVEKVFPELVTTKADGYKAVKYGNLVAPLIQSTKELYGMCKANESQWRALASVVDNNARVTDARINSLQDQVNQLKEENRALQMQVREIKSLLLNK